MNPQVNNNRKRFQLDRSATVVPKAMHNSTVGGGGNGGGGARYKLMSPAALPISRSTNIMIPPGLSPTSFLESPAFISNIKAEPSPTTGSFFKPRPVHVSSGSSYTGRAFHQDNTFTKQRSSIFGFRLPASNMVNAELDKQRSEPAVGQANGSSHSPSSIIEAAASSSDLSRPTPSPQTTPTSSDVPAGTEQDESVQVSQNDSKGSTPSVLADDGYNWRKYGTKPVKGSEFYRSYYKCRHPNCEVKKTFERSRDGQITDTVYKGTHDHPKPQPSQPNSGGLGMPAQDERVGKYPPMTGRDENGVDNLSQAIVQTSNPEVPPTTEKGGEVEVPNGNKDDQDDDDPSTKRRRLAGTLEVTPPVEPIQEPIQERRVVVQTLSEVDLLEDGYRWRKYGQKIVKGNPNPRSYYRCTTPGCPARKQVERSPHDPKAVITAYQGKHSHDFPISKRKSNRDIQPRVRPDETDTISLNLGLGISSKGPDHTSNERQHQNQQPIFQTLPNVIGFASVHATPIPSYHASLNRGMNQYGPRATRNVTRNGDISSLYHSSYPYPHYIGGEFNQVLRRQRKRQ